MLSKKEERRECILNTARTLILKNGLQSTSMNLISRGSEIAIGSIYTIFDSKEALVNELYQESRDILFRNIVSPSESDSDPEKSFHTIFRKYFHTAMENRDVFLFVEQYHLSPVISETQRIESDFRFGNKKISQLVAEGILRNMDIVLIDAIILGTINMILCIHFSNNITLTDEIIEQSLDACWKAIANPNRQTD